MRIMLQDDLPPNNVILHCLYCYNATPYLTLIGGTGVAEML